MDFARWSVILSIGLFVAMEAFFEIGYRAGRREAARLPESAYRGIGALEAAVFALLGLLLAFSFSSATSRLEARHQLIVQEANAIGRGYRRVDLLPAAFQPEMRHLFAQYLDERLRAYEKLPDLKAAEQEIERAQQLQQAIWSLAVDANRADPSLRVDRNVLPALDRMNEVSTSRTVALYTRLPGLIFFLLICVALLSALLAGYAMAERKRRSWLYLLSYALVIAITVYAVLDLDNPRFGLIRLDQADRALLQLRDSIH